MKTLVIGNGAREHAIAWAISRSNKVDKLYCAPGNAGISKVADCIDIGPTMIQDLVNFAKSKSIDLTVVGPEAPLVEGIVDEFEQNELKIFGPNKMCSMLEGSKIFCKNLLRRYLIPTAPYKVFYNKDTALKGIRNSPYPIVVKADGLCQGKGTFVCRNHDEAEEAIINLMDKQVFGEAGTKILIEDFLDGEEVSIIGITDGGTVAVLEPARDYKKIYSGDHGPNTGGMGCYSPVPYVSSATYRQVSTQIFAMLVHALNKEERNFKGILYAGLMLTSGGPKVLEFNVRLGDPEAQVLLPRLQTDLVDIVTSVTDKTLHTVNIEWSNKKSVGIVLASGGYPSKYETGHKIEGLESTDASTNIFISGVATKNGDLVTSGGRVLTVQALGDTFTEARNNAYNRVESIKFRNSYFRDDIAANVDRRS